jgi:hypothetical protein
MPRRRSLSDLQGPEYTDMRKRHKAKRGTQLFIGRRAHLHVQTEEEVMLANHIGDIATWMRDEGKVRQNGKEVV